jgi:small subunit ribosomal protein S17
METTQLSEQRGRRKIKIGKVVSAKKMDKTILVAVERQVAHPLYKKYFKKTNKFMTHDAENTCNEGDTVRIMETRPLSAKKRWRLVEVIERAK